MDMGFRGSNSLATLGLIVMMPLTQQLDLIYPGDRLPASGSPIAAFIWLLPLHAFGAVAPIASWLSD